MRYEAGVPRGYTATKFAIPFFGYSIDGDRVLEGVSFRSLNGAAWDASPFPWKCQTMDQISGLRGTTTLDGRQI